MAVMARMIGGALGGALGGAAVGLGEAAIVAASGQQEYWAFVFGVLCYGCAGAAMGGGWGLVCGVMPRFRPAWAACGSAAATVAALAGMVVGRFRIVRDVFAESLPILSAAGLAVHVGLVVAAVCVFALVNRLVGRSAASGGVARVALMWIPSTLGLAVLLAMGLGVVAGGARPESTVTVTAKGPNVVLIIADTLRADHTGSWGAAGVSTPALDRLAADGVVFENAVAQSSWTRPSIATILTSLYPASHQVMHKTDLLPDEVVTVAEAMVGAGYRTSGFVTNINVAPSFNFDQGFHSYRYLAPDFFFGASDSASKLTLYSALRLVRERFISRSKYVNNYYQDAETVNGGALPWLEGNSGEPFFVLIHYMDPHDPYMEIPYNGRGVARVNTPHPPPERASELRKLYASNVEYMDGFLSSLFARLEEAGAWDDTVIVFTSDHGEEFFEHGGWWHGTTLYEEQIHVPLIVKLAGGRRGGEMVASTARLLDVAPTLLGAAGVEQPPAFQGRDLFGGDPAPRAVYAQEDHEGNVLEALRTPEWKLIVANPGNPRGLAVEELYDLGADPGESVNLAAKEPRRVEAMKSELAALRELAAASAVTAVEGEIDEASRERLRALGYIQ